MKINVPPATRAFIALTIFLTFLYVVATHAARVSAEPGTIAPASSIPYLTLIPAQFYYYPWTILTSTFVEQNVLNFLINTTAVYFAGKYLERAWGSKDFTVLVLVASIVPNLLLIPTYMIWGAILRNTTRADTPIAGAITLQAAFLVCFKQLVPEHTVSLYKGLIKTRVKHFPAIFLAINTAGGIIFGTDTALLLAWYGLITTYVYLRFFRYQQDLDSTTNGSGIRGDASETFAFSTFFPAVIQPPIAAVCDQIYILCCKMKLIKPFSEEAILSGNEQAAVRGEAVLPTNVNHSHAAAERRRQLALKALDERLNATNEHHATASAGLQSDIPSDLVPSKG